ncbi:MAG: TonB-dependent receptor [Vicinamibacterales bacterium]
MMVRRKRDLIAAVRTDAWSTGLVVAAVLVSGAVLRAQDTTGVGTIAGVVSDAQGTLTANVRVCALDTAACATSDAVGAFRLGELRAGAYRLEIVPLDGMPFVSEPIDVRPGTDARVEITLPALEAIQSEITVTAPTFDAPPEVKTSGFLLEPREILKSAGALQDVARYVQNLPGVVVGTDDFRNDIIVRGGSPLENLFVVDNIEIPNINSFATFASAGGSASLLDPQLLQDVTFLTGGYPAPFTNRTSSVLQITQREGSRQRRRGWATVGFAGAGGILEGPLNNGRGSWVVSVRRSFLDFFTDDIGIGGVPVLYSINAKAVYDLSPRDRVWAVNVSGVDRIRLGLTESTDLTDEIANFDIRYEGWRAATGFNWQRTFGAHAVGLLGVTQSRASVQQQVKDLVRESVPPPDTPVDALIGRSPVVFSEDSGETETTVKYDLTFHVAGFEKVQAGASTKLFQIRYATASPFGSESPFSPTAGDDAFDIGTSYRTTQHAAYVQATRRVSPRFDLTVGGRFDRYAQLDASRVSPRVGVEYRWRDTLSSTASYGVYHQQPAFLFVSAFPDNAALSPWRADHYVAGLAWKPRPGVRVTLEGYRKTYRDYPVARHLPSVSLANLGDTFNIREVLFPLVSEGRGTSQGVELFAERRQSDTWYGQASLAFSRTRHAGLDDRLRPGSFDYPIVFNVLGGYRLSPAWEVSTRLAYLSGRPYTPFDEQTSAAQRRGVYDLSQVNGARAPDYLRVDLRVDRTFRLGGQALNVFAGVQNLTNRRNFGGYSWNRRTNSAQFGEQQGTFPILGMDYRF